MIQELNVECKDKCGQLNLVRATKNTTYKNKKLKQTPLSTLLSRAQVQERQRQSKWRYE